MDVVLLPVPSKMKGPTLKGWNSTTIERMDDPEYLAQFTGNIGVLLGKASGNLCTIDVDSDDDFAAFLTLNPLLADTLQTRGSRGGNIWIRVRGDYPELTYLKRQDGSTWGEFRSTGAQTIVHGIHSKGNTYQRLVDAKPIEIEFDEIVWPETVVQSWIDRDYNDLVEKEGEPFYISENGGVTFNEPSIVEKFVRESITLYESDEGSFYQYDEGTGLWMIRTDNEIKAQFSDDLKRASDDLANTRILGMRTSQRLSSLMTILKGRVGRKGVFAERQPLIHCKNGMLDLSTNPPVFRTFDPNDYSRNASPIEYDPCAQCPQFLNGLLYSAVHEDDISLIQRVGGAMLMGTNSAQRFLLLTGTAGGGKSTLVSILTKIIGKQNVNELRTEHLSGRFETFSYLGKTLLTGIDVPSDFLQQKGTHKIKSLVGGDHLQCEKKGGAQFQMKGDFNMIVTCNSRLRVQMDGDLGAWYRRILTIPYERPKPERIVDDFDDKLIADEGSGILNFFVQGAIQHLEELEAVGNYRVTPEQERRVVELLRESESVRHFVDTCVVNTVMGDVTNNELNAAYFAYCGRNGWKPYSARDVNGKLPELMLELRHVHEAHDIMRDGRNQRGYRRIAIQQEAQ
jgi:P4 family phage/plasmid primase-like protien